MPGPERHPLERTYDDTQRSITRIKRYIEMFRPMLAHSDIEKYEQAIEHLKVVKSTIPKMHRKTYKEWKKDADN